KEHQQLALKIAEQSMVLLKNENSLLPFDQSSLKSIAVIGPNANVARTGGHGSSKVIPFYAVTPLEGIKNLVGENIQVHFAVGEELVEPELKLIDSQYLTPSQGKGKGLYGEYFDNVDFAGKPVFTRVDQDLDFDFKDDTLREVMKKDSFSIRWTGTFMPPETKEYKFDLNSDDGSRLYINDELLIDNWGVHPPRLKSGTIKLETGKSYQVKIEYAEIGFGAMFQFGWSPPFDFEAYKKKVNEAVGIAKKSDVVVLCAGSADFIEGEGLDKEGLELPGHQDYLIEKVAEANPNTVVVLYGCAPMSTKKWLDKVNGLVLAWFPGQEGGNGLARILFGEVNPSGKLPFSYIQDYAESPVFKQYKDEGMKMHYDEGVFIGYRWLDKNKVPIKFPFGYGLSYTQFKFSNMKIEEHGDSKFTVHVNVENVGERKGAEVVQLYVGDIACKVPRPEKELKGFEKVELNPGENKDVAIHLEKPAFSFYNVETHSWEIEPGEFEIMVGSSSRDIHLKKSINLSIH
ncbi:MAG: glycoside hydrolase family 3 C-terminal domain-containing protein, partial [bacterium]